MVKLHVKTFFGNVFPCVITQFKLHRKRYVNVFVRIYVRIHIRTCVQLNVYEYLDTAVKNDIKESTYPTRISFLRCPDEEENPAYRPHSDITQLSRSKATSIPAFRSNTSRSVPKRTTHRFGIPLAITYC